MASETNIRTTAEDINAAIREKIVRGQLAPNTRITEQALATEFGTSRTPVREAMRQLVAEGFLTFKPNSGSFVRNWTMEEIDEIFQLRTLVESEVAAQAALRISDVQIAELEAVQNALEESTGNLHFDGVSKTSQFNWEFHRLVAHACGNGRLIKMMADAIELPIVQRTFTRYSPSEMRRSHHHHRELIDALHAKDPDWARAVMHCHISSARAVMARHERRNT